MFFSGALLASPDVPRRLEGIYPKRMAVRETLSVFFLVLRCLSHIPRMPPVQARGRCSARLRNSPSSVRRTGSAAGGLLLLHRRPFGVARPPKSPPTLCMIPNPTQCRDEPSPLVIIHSRHHMVVLSLFICFDQVDVRGLQNAAGHRHAAVAARFGTVLSPLPAVVPSPFVRLPGRGAAAAGDVVALAVEVTGKRRSRGGAGVCSAPAPCRPPFRPSTVPEARACGRPAGSRRGCGVRGGGRRRGACRR